MCSAPKLYSGASMKLSSSRTRQCVVTDQKGTDAKSPTDGFLSPVSCAHNYNCSACKWCRQRASGYIRPIGNRMIHILHRSPLVVSFPSPTYTHTHRPSPFLLSRVGNVEAASKGNPTAHPLTVASLASSLIPDSSAGHARHAHTRTHTTTTAQRVNGVVNEPVATSGQ